MADKFTINARERERAGTSLVRRLRREGEIPAVIYGANKDNVNIAIDHDTILHSLDSEAFTSAIIEIDIAGKKENAIVRSAQRHPYKPKILHVDFQRVDEKQTITMALPIHLIGEEDCAGVKNDGGILARLLQEVEISCLPKDLPENLELDVTELGLNESLHLSDIKLPEGVALTAFSHSEDISEYDQAVVSVSAPKAAAEPAEGEEGADAEASDKNEETSDA